MRPLAYPLAGVLALVATAAVAQDTGPADIRVVADTFLSQIIEPVIQLLSGLALAAITWLSLVFKQKTGLVIEAKHAEALHKAVMTGVSSAVKSLGAGAPVGQIVKEAITYTKESVPDAINALRPGANVLTNLAMSKLELLLLGTQTPAPTPTATLPTSISSHGKAF